MVQPRGEIADARLRRALKTVAERSTDVDSSEESPPGDVSGTRFRGNPWFTAYMKEFFETMRFAPHETMDDPIVCK